MALQRVTSFNLQDPELLPVFHSIYRTPPSENKGGSGNSFRQSRILGLNPHMLYFISGDLAKEDLKKFASDKLSEFIIPELDKGNLIFLAITTKRENTHYILVSSFNHETKRFLVNDSSDQENLEWDFSKMAERWPVFADGKRFVYGASLSVPTPTSDVLLDLPQTIELSVGVDILSELKLAEGTTFPNNLKVFDKQKSENVIAGAKVVPVSRYWEPARKVDDVHGIALWLKIKAAQRDPACLFFSICE